MAGSTVVALKRAIIDGLTSYLGGLADFNGTTAPERRVVVTYGYDFGAYDAERIFTGRARFDTPPAGLKAGRNHRNESGTFDLVVLVQYVGGDAEDAEDRALDIGAEVETWLADRKSNELGVSGLQSLTVQGGDLVPMGNDNGHMAELTYRVAWKARLT